MALTPVIPGLHSLCLPIATAGITMGRVPYLTIGGAPLVAGVGQALVRCQTVAATVHRCYTPHDEDNGEETEDHDVEHGPLDHGLLEKSRPHCCLAGAPSGDVGYRRPVRGNIRL